MLKAVNEYHTIIGSVRGYEKEKNVHIGKLIVHPDCQRQGIGTRLLNRIETELPCKRYELFTSSKSKKNIALYEKLGFRIFDEKVISDKLCLVYLEKRI